MKVSFVVRESDHGRYDKMLSWGEWQKKLKQPQEGSNGGMQLWRVSCCQFCFEHPGYVSHLFPWAKTFDIKETFLDGFP
jgi:hypothetical protein